MIKRPLIYFLFALFLFPAVSPALPQDEDSIKIAFDSMMNALGGNTSSDTILQENAEQASGPSGQEVYMHDTIHPHNFDRKNWKNVTDGLNYDEKREKPKPTKQEQEDHETKFEDPGDHKSWFEGMSTMGQVLLISIAIVVISFVLYKLFAGNMISNTKVNKQQSFTLQDIEEKLHESDLDRFLREAIESKEFRLAIRLYFLLTIRELSLRDWIVWKKDKTNNQYVFEMSSRPNFEKFREITRLFEYSWYGEMKVEEPQFNMIAPRFSAFLMELKNMPA